MYVTTKIKCDSINDVYKIERSKILNKNLIYLIESDKLQRIEANELLNLLKSHRDNGEHAFRYNI